jgi:hypothetical protein
MARNRSTILIAAGAGLFVLAAAVGVLALGGDDGGDSNDPPVVTVAPAAQQSGGDNEGQAAPPALRIPDGKEAVSVSVAAVPGLAGHVKTGDRVNVYGTFRDRQPNSPVRGVPLAKLILSNVEVLGVSNAGTNVTYVLAVNAVEAEKVIYLASFEGIWLTLVRDGAPAVGGTPGHNASNAA